MEDSEKHSKAVIASALIVSGAIAIPSCGSALSHAEGLRLCELTDQVYRLLTGATGAEVSSDDHRRSRSDLSTSV